MSPQPCPAIVSAGLLQAAYGWAQTCQLIFLLPVGRDGAVESFQLGSSSAQRRLGLAAELLAPGSLAAGSVPVTGDISIAGAQNLWQPREKLLSLHTHL